MFSTFPSPFSVFNTGFLFIIITVMTLVIHFAFAFGIKEDGEQLQIESRGPLFVKPPLWGLATLLGGLPVVALYWVMHRSSLSTLQSKP
jgi:hypothetical protein